MKFIKVLIFLLISANSFAQYYSPVKTPIQWTQGGFDSLFIPARDTITPSDKTKPWITYRAPTLYVWTTNKWTAISGGGGGGGSDYVLPQADSNTLGGIRYNTDFALDGNNRLGIAPGKKALWNTIANLPLFYATGDSTRGMIRDSIAAHKLKFNPDNFNIFPDSVDIINKPFTEADSIYMHDPAHFLTGDDITNIQNITDTSIHPLTSDVHNWINGIKMDTVKFNSSQFYKTPDSVINIYGGDVVGSSSNAVVTTTDSLRTLSNIDPGTVYETTDKGGGFWRYDLFDVSTPDNTGTVIVNGTKRLKRIYSGKANIVWFGAVGDGIADNYNVLHQFWTNTNYPSDIYIPEGTFYSSKQDSITRFVHVTGKEGYEIATVSNVLSYPKGVSGPVLNNANSAGSIIEGISIISTMPTGGNVMEYNPTNQTLLYLTVLNTPVTGQSYEFFDPYNAQTSIGTATISSISTGLFSILLFNSESGTFQIGDVLTGSTSGATATVKFVSKRFNAVNVGIITGTFIAGETVIGSTSGATGVFRQRNFTNGTSAMRVATLTSVTGTLDTVNAEGRRITVFRETSTNSTGVTLNRRAQLKNVTISGFGGDGVLVTNLTTPVTNANLARLYNIRSISNAANGVKVEGGDANLIEINGSTFVNNRGFAIVDGSFLGITVNTPHASLNLAGSYYSGSYINRKSTWINPYAEGGYIVAPYQAQESYISGGSQAIGGTRGSGINNDPLISNGGADFDIEHIQNNRVYTDFKNQTTKGVTTVFKTLSASYLAYPLAIEMAGFNGTGRGVGFEARGPLYWDGVAPKYQGKTINVSSLYGNQSWQVIGNEFLHRNRLRRNIPPFITVAGSGGAGAIVVANVLGGTITSVDVLAGGDGYPTNGTTAVATGGTGASLQAIVQDGHIVEVKVLSGGSGFADTDMMDIFETSSINGGIFRPVNSGTGALGDNTHAFSKVVTNSLTLPINPTPSSPVSGQHFNDGSHEYVYLNNVWQRVDNQPIASLTIIDSPEHVLTGIVTWTATASPTGTTSTYYKWTQKGQEVTLSMRFVAVGAGTGVTAATITLPSELPTPETWTGANAANNIIMPGTGWLSTSSSGSLATSFTARAYLAVNSTANGYVAVISTASASHVAGLFQVTYKAAMGNGVAP